MAAESIRPICPSIPRKTRWRSWLACDDHGGHHRFALQGSGQGDGTDQTDTTGAGAVGGGAAAIPSVGLQRGEPLEMMPLAKMLELASMLIR